MAVIPIVLVVFILGVLLGMFLGILPESEWPYDVTKLRNENKALKGKLHWMHRQADPVLSVQSKHIASLQAKLHEHKLAYKGLQTMMGDVAKERDQLRTQVAELLRNEFKIKIP